MKSVFPADVIWGYFLIFQLCIGYLGNLFVFVSCWFTCFSKSHLTKSVASIFMKLTLVNVLTITFRLIPDVMSSFGREHFLDNGGCKAMMYIFRVTRGLSITTTSFLSIFQAITISPSHSKWTRLKPQLTEALLPSFLAFGMVNMLLYTIIITNFYASRNVTTVRLGYNQIYCRSEYSGLPTSVVFLSVTVIQDMVFVLLMVGSSLYMVILLYQHHQRVQHVISTHLSSPSSPEIRATQSIVVLVSCFVFFYCTDSCFILYLTFSADKNLRLERICGSISSCYPTICPFVLLRNKKMIFYFRSCLPRVRTISSP